MKKIISEVNGIGKVSTSKRSRKRIPTGFPDLDEKLSGGLQPAELVLIAGRAGMGKTTFAMNIADYASRYENKRIAIFSLPLLEGHLLASDNSFVDESKVMVYNTWEVSVDEICSECRELKAEQGLDMIIIDYIQLVGSSDKSVKENRRQQISQMASSLKALAKELELSVIVLSQMSRKIEARADKRPTLSDLRESRAFGEEADLCMLLHGDAYYNRECEDKNTAEIIIAKQKNGSTGTVRLVWRFNDIYRDESKIDELLKEL